MATEASNRPAFEIAVVIPCYKVTKHIGAVIAAVGPQVAHIYCVDDACPDGSGEFIRNANFDPRIRVLFHDVNRGVGGAVLTGYKAAAADGAHVIVKLDGDGQTDPLLLASFVGPIIDGIADYTKGNRFSKLEDIRSMPAARLFGNAVLSFMSKLSTGYWRIFDPTNGYTAIHSRVLAQLPLEKISRDYFFESDMLFRLNIIGAVVLDIPMTARYESETSNLRIRKIITPFLRKHAVNFFKRIVYNYYLRDFNLASLELLLGVALLIFSLLFGVESWWTSAQTGIPATAGTVMVAALPFFVGLQLLLGFFSYDMQTVASIPLHKILLHHPSAPPSQPNN